MILLKNRFNLIGILLISFSILLLICEFVFSFKINFLNKVKSLSFLPTNLSFGNNDFSFIEYHDFNYTFISIILLIGLLIISISEVKSETEKTKIIRFNTFVLTFKIYVFINVLIFLFVWGISFLYLITFNIFLPLIIYNSILHYKLFKNRNQSH